MPTEQTLGERPLAEGRANLLYETQSARANAKILWTVHAFGNWVGGQVSLYPDRLVFQMNRMNAAAQADSTARTLLARDVTGVAEGRMLAGLARTVDLATTGGPWRLRCSGALKRQVVDAAQGWAAASRR